MHLKGPKAYILISLKRYYIPLCKMGDAGELQAISLFLAARKFQIAKKLRRAQQENTTHATHCKQE
jgi:hypothetical protein